MRSGWRSWLISTELRAPKTGLTTLEEEETFAGEQKADAGWRRLKEINDVFFLLNFDMKLLHFEPHTSEQQLPRYYVLQVVKVDLIEWIRIQLSTVRPKW